MPSNLKKMVRARMDKTGESYQQALRHVREQNTPPSPATSLCNIVEGIIELAQKRDEESRTDPLNQQLVVNMADMIRRLREPQPPTEAKLERALDGLPDDVLWKIEALYYAARDGYGIAEALREVPKDRHALTVAHLMEKAPLAELLVEGLRMAGDEDFDLDADW